MSREPRRESRREPRIQGLRRIFHLPASRRSVDRDINDEIRFHLESRVDELVRQGRSRDAARAEAEREFGDVRAARADLAAVDRRRLGRWGRADWWDGLRQDARYAARGVGRSRGFTAVVVLTLGLGVGANTTMFGIIDRLLLRPPAHLRDPETAGRVYLTRTIPDGTVRSDNNISFRRYLELRQWTRAFSHVAAFFNTEFVVGTGVEARQLRVGMVSASFWPLFGVRPALGRFFTAEEDREPDGTAVAVLSYGLWRSRFAGDPGALGKALRIGAKTYTIIGVAPKGFTGVEPTGVVAFIPITAGAVELGGGDDYYLEHNMSWMEMIARRRPGVSVAAANADLTSAYRRSMASERRARPLEQSRPRGELGPMLFDRGPKQREGAKVATWLTGMSAVVLLIACANVANLLLARGLRRRREIAVRIALGVSRGRLLRQLVTESVLLAALGALAGLALAHWGGGVLRALLMPDVEWTSTLADRRTLLFTAAVALGAGLLTGLAPAVHARRRDLTGALKASAREGTRQHSRLRSTLLVAQAALSVILLVGAGLFVRSLHNVRGLDMGFDPERVLYVAPDLRGVDLPAAEQRALYQRMLDRAASLARVEHAGLTLTVPFWMNIVTDLYVPGIDSVARLGDFYQNAVSADYFAAMGTTIVRGRGITDADRTGSARVVVVSQSMARVLWPKQEPLGQCLKIEADTVPCSEVVGIAQDIVRGDLRGDAGLQYYVPTDQRAGDFKISGLFVRPRGDARRAMEPIRREMQRLMPGQAYVRAVQLQEIVDPEIRPWRLGATMFGVFGLLALAMAAVGLYSVIAYDVAQRTHEFGVRVALGARTADVLRLVLGEGVRVAVVGIALGTGVALLAGRFVAALLYRESPRDPAVFVTVGATLLVVAAAASLLPAWRAARVDPTVALRAE